MKSRRFFLKQGSLATAAILVTKPFFSFAGSIKSIAGINILESHISLLHTGNLYSRFSPVADNSLYQGLGGFENTGNMIALLKKRLPNVVLLDAGNHATDKLLDDTSKQTSTLMQQLGYDAVAATTSHTGVPLIAKNKDGFKIIEKGAIRIGVISTEAVDNNIASVNELANNIKADYRCNLIICLSSLGYKKNNADDHALAASSKNIDIILGAADGTFMKTPDIAQNQDKNEVVINHTGYAGIVLGKLDISFDEKGNKKAITFDNLMIGTPNQRWIKPTA